MVWALSLGQDGATGGAKPGRVGEIGISKSTLAGVCGDGFEGSRLEVENHLGK